MKRTRALVEIAHARAGDKGDTSIIVLRPYRRRDYDRLSEVVTADVIAVHFAVPVDQVGLVPAPELATMTIVVRSRLDGGVTRSARIDPHGKTLSGHLLDLQVSWSDAG